MCLIYDHHRTVNGPTVTSGFKVYIVKDGVLRSPYYPNSPGGTVSAAGTYEAEMNGGTVSYLRGDGEEIRFLSGLNSQWHQKPINTPGFHCFIYNRDAERLVTHLRQWGAWDTKFRIVRVSFEANDVIAVGETPMKERFKDAPTVVVSKMTIQPEDFAIATT